MSFKGWKYIDLFAGVGAFHLALNNAGAECVFASEIDDNAADVYEMNHGIRPSGDITTVEADQIPAHDILCAGFPCQPFSVGGRRLGFEDTRGTLFFEIIRIASHHRPRVLLLENVRNLESHDGGRTFDTMKACLQDIGYRVHSKVLDASNFWSPQKRERIFIVALRKDIQLDHRFFWPMKGLAQYCVEDMLDLDFKKSMTQEFVHEKDFDGRTNRIARVGRFGNGGQGYRVYDPRGLGTTLCSAGGGGGANTGVYLINGEPRTLTARECARLSGFPESFKLHPRERQAIRQFGNSIVVTALSAVVAATAAQVDRFYRLNPEVPRLDQALHGSQFQTSVSSGLSKGNEVSRDVLPREAHFPHLRLVDARQRTFWDFDPAFDDVGGRDGFHCLAPGQDQQDAGQAGDGHCTEKHAVHFPLLKCDFHKFQERAQALRHPVSARPRSPLSQAAPASRWRRHLPIEGQHLNGSATVLVRTLEGSAFCLTSPQYGGFA